MIFFWGKLIEEEMVRITTQRRRRAGSAEGASKSYKVHTLGLTMQVDNETRAYD